MYLGRLLVWKDKRKLGQTDNREPQLSLSAADGTLKKVSHGDRRTVN